MLKPPLPFLSHYYPHGEADVSQSRLIPPTVSAPSIIINQAVRVQLYRIHPPLIHSVSSFLSFPASHTCAHTPSHSKNINTLLLLMIHGPVPLICFFFAGEMLSILFILFVSLYVYTSFLISIPLTHSRTYSHRSLEMTLF